MLNYLLSSRFPSLSFPVARATMWTDERAEQSRADETQLTGQRKNVDSGDNSLASNFSGLRPPYW